MTHSDPEAEAHAITYIGALIDLSVFSHIWSQIVMNQYYEHSLSIITHFFG